MPILTPNFAYNQPLVNNAIDADLWGAQLNTNWGSLDTNLAYTTSAETADFTVALSEFNFTFLIDASSNSVTAMVPSAAFNGFVVRFKAVDVTNVITIDGNGATIDGQASVEIPAVNGVLELTFDGTNWALTTTTPAESTETISGTVEKATQTEAEAETADKNITADNAVHLPGAASAWCVFDGTGTPSVKEHYNASTITDLGAGLYRINFDEDMATTTYFATGSVGFSGGTATTGDFIVLTDKQVTHVDIRIEDINGNTSDQEDVNIIVFGRRA